MCSNPTRACFAGNSFIGLVGPVGLPVATAVAVTVTPKSTATLHRITAGSGPGARREVWPASNYQVAAWNYLQVDSLVKLVAHRDLVYHEFCPIEQHVGSIFES